jgi:hypothetical protein
MKAIRSILPPVLAVLIAVLALGTWHRAAPVSEASFEQVRKESELGGYRLVGTQELWGWYQAEPKDLLLVDTRQEWEYRTGHIEGAVNFPMTPAWWARWRARGALETLLGSDKERTIVFY